MCSKDKIKTLFKNNNIKYTHQREKVYSFLMKTNEPVVAEYIFFMLNKDDSGINLSTVYRTLELFAEKRLIFKSYSTLEKKQLYEINRFEHKHHLICTNCMKIVPIKGCPLEGYEEHLRDTTAYKITEHKLEIYGICPECQNENAL